MTLLTFHTFGDQPRPLFLNPDSIVGIGTAFEQNSKKELGGAIILAISHTFHVNESVDDVRQILLTAR